MDGEPFPPPPATDNDGQRFYLKRLMKWAENAGVKVDKLTKICHPYYMFDYIYSLHDFVNLYNTNACNRF